MRNTTTILIPILLLTAVMALTADDKHAAWSYEGDSGPEHWGDLDPAYALCETGKKQSPIDLVIAEEKDGDPLEFHYGESKVNLVNNGHTIQQNLDPGSYVEYRGKRFNAQQFHFHHESEHSFKGVEFPMEMHIVHAAEDGELLVVGIAFELGEANEFLAGFWGKMPEEHGGTFVDEGMTITLAEALPKDSGIYSYSGSLTTPPGTEGVNWFVFEETVSLDDAQGDAYQKLHPNSDRPLQPLNGRSVTLWRR